MPLTKAAVVEWKVNVTFAVGRLTVGSGVNKGIEMFTFLAEERCKRGCEGGGLVWRECA